MNPFSLKLTRLGVLAVSAIMSQSLYAGSVSIPNSFTAGEPAVAAEVNANFDAVKTAVDDNDSRIATLEATIASLQETVAAQATTISNLQNNISSVQSNSVLALDGSLQLVTDINGYPTAQFTGVNVQVINGVDQYAANGVGNLIVGYNGIRFGVDSVCSDGAYNTDQATCEANGGIWAANHKSGSHNLVGGVRNSYSSTGGLVFGSDNAINGAGAVVTGGYNNVASGSLSSVSAGVNNTASELHSSVSGGASNIASGRGSSVSGGAGNTASGDSSSVSGGQTRSATDLFDWAAGSLFEDF